MSEGAERNAALRDRTKAFASRSIKLYIYLQQTYQLNDAARVIAKQLLRSGTSFVPRPSFDRLTAARARGMLLPGGSARRDQIVVEVFAVFRKVVVLLAVEVG